MLYIRTNIVKKNSKLKQLKFHFVYKCISPMKKLIIDKCLRIITQLNAILHQ